MTTGRNGHHTASCVRYDDVLDVLFKVLYNGMLHKASVRRSRHILINEQILIEYLLQHVIGRVMSYSR